MNIKQVQSDEDLRNVRGLIEEYTAWLGADFYFKGIEKELRDLPGEYSPPDGRLLLALDEGQMAGCIALRRIDPDACELKRLYVRPQFRGRGAGAELVKAIIEDAQSIGYRRMRLDTLPRRMEQALSVYRKFGFKDIEPYFANPIEGTLYLELAL